MKRNDQEWLSLYEEYKASGLSQTQFCRSKRLCAKNFAKRQQALLDQPKGKKTIKDGHFVQLVPPVLSTSLSNPTPSSVVIEYKGAVIRMNTADAPLIASVVNGLL